MEGDAELNPAMSESLGSVAARSTEEGVEVAAASSSINPPGGRDVEEIFAQVHLRWTCVAARPDGTMVCVECGREGHPCCGLRYWTSLRAAWLRAPEEEILREPGSFEDAGPLQLARADLAGPVRDLSEGELEDLEDCLDAVQRPFPRLRRSVPLMQAVQCAEALWDTDDE
mmetsp:Transcript_49929/g.115919  ORF Transcript_49929/g.115919 Transcript_49929/m.115919 type:complete len:171 (+) Transcript_49929:174-686(+)|eukprot:CAMPEP_0171110406 /NCGR_PEP_ID=MMETSP0766_2-20121228/71333_1 /TAXON_ID=439317 /ORGANISM="Gambierdiscus australes, Strain CAWD 149" /LENGTH=170 /DNA_ID=CAMNT_0011572269 /DNA_START=173 /DNA_END=685 /DNA_ORIENTATION=+